MEGASSTARWRGLRGCPRGRPPAWAPAGGTWAAVAALGRPELIEAIEALRAVAIADNPLGLRVQQLVQFGQLLVLGQEGPARLHAAAALRHGASVAELLGVAETAFITAGVPAFSLGVRVIDELR